MWNCVHSSVFRHVSWTAAIRSSSSFASEYLFFLVSHLQLKCKVWISGGEKQNNIRVTKLFAQKKHFIIENIFHLQYLICADLFHPPSSYHISKLHSETWGGSAVFFAEYLYAVFKHKCCVCHWLFYYLITMSVHLNWWLSISAGSDKLSDVPAFCCCVAYNSSVFEKRVDNMDWKGQTNFDFKFFCLIQTV